MNKNSKKYPSFLEAFWVWVKVAIYSFGGPANQIAVMHKLIVEEKKWVGEQRFLHALNYCMLLPGPEAQQLAIYLGWLLHRYWGGIVAGSLFVLPGFLTILSLSIIYAKYASLSFITILFYGIKPAVIAIVLDALFRIGKKALKKKISFLIAMAVFVGIFFFNIPFPIIVFGAAIFGYLSGRFWKSLLSEGEKYDDAHEQDLVSCNKYVTQRSIGRTILTASVWLAIWLFPAMLTVWITGFQSVFTQEAIFFSKTAVVTIGGAYAVLAYIAQQAVQNYAWLKPGEMLDGLGLAETTPGPLIQVVQFVAFLGAYRHAGGMSPLLAGILGSVITTWVTFAPSFLWIFTGAPYIEKLRKIPSLHSAMKAITAAVVGVILNLSIWFALHTLFQTVVEKHFSSLRLYIPAWSTFDLGTAIIMVYACVVVFRYKAGLFTVLSSSVLLGFLLEALKYYI